MEYFLASRNDAHPQYLARLDGARIIVAEEAPSNARWKGDLLKRFTGGGQIEARFMGRGSFTYAPRGTLFLALNQLPDIAVVDDAITRRLMIVRFPFKPETPDIHLAAKLEADLPVVVRWLLDGAEEYIERGLDVPDTIANSTEAYLESQDSPKRFLAECPKGEHLSCLRTALTDLLRGMVRRSGSHPPQGGSVLQASPEDGVWRKKEEVRGNRASWAWRHPSGHPPRRPRRGSAS